jgi:hypothetical protein
VGDVEEEAVFEIGIGGSAAAAAGGGGHGADDDGERLGCGDGFDE